MNQGSTRTVVALWGVDADGVHGSSLREALRRGGARRLQVNISDDAVAGAMSIREFPRPIEAVLTVDGGSPGDVVAAAREVADDVAAWQVTRRAPLDPDLPVGVRVDALSNMAFLRKPADLTYDEWRRRWLDEHTQVAIDTQATFGYYQNIVSKPLTDNAIEVVAIVEELFGMAAVGDMHAFYGSGGDDAELRRRLTALLASVHRMGADRNLDLVPTSRYDYLLTT